MDGGGRVLRSLIDTVLFPQARARFAGLPDGFESAAAPPIAPRHRTGKRPPSVHRRALQGIVGTLLSVALFAGIGVYGSTRNGEYAAFVREHGAPFDVVAKALGFPIDSIAITGPKVLEPKEILDAAGINPNQSLIFLNAGDIRDRLRAVPLVRDAVVTKLIPNRLTIAIDERDPVAIWQLDGKLSIVSGDGVVIDDVHDDRFTALPFVVGAGANGKVGEFLALLDAAGDLRPRIVAGMRIGDRRWTLKMDNGTVVALPELGAVAALTRLASIEKQARFLDKDIVSIDLRMPGRVTARLSDDAAAARADMLAKKNKGKGTPE